MSKQSVATPPQDNYEIEEDYTLKQALGGIAGVAKIFSSENIERAQKVIDDARDDFFSSNLISLHGVKEELLGDDKAGLQVGEKELSRVYDHVLALRSQASALKFPFISKVCAHVEDVCTSPRQAKVNYRYLIRDMLEILRLALQNRIVDDQHPIAQEVIKSLTEVSARLHK